jgi:hypothetical protein
LLLPHLGLLPHFGPLPHDLRSGTNLLIAARRQRALLFELLLPRPRRAEPIPRSLRLAVVPLGLRLVLLRRLVYIRPCVLDFGAGSAATPTIGLSSRRGVLQIGSRTLPALLCWLPKLTPCAARRRLPGRVLLIAEGLRRLLTADTVGAAACKSPALLFKGTASLLYSALLLSERHPLRPRRLLA